jgi:hypothetical protein
MSWETVLIVGLILNFALTFITAVIAYQNEKQLEENTARIEELEKRAYS